MAIRRLNRRQTAYVLAVSMGLAIALAVAFFILAMPQTLFEALVVSLGLADAFVAAAPPLGATARIGAAAVAALASGMLVGWAFVVTENTSEEPRRTAPRPIFANEEFGISPIAGAPEQDDPLYFDLASIRAGAARPADNEPLDLGAWAIDEEPAEIEAEQTEPTSEPMSEGESIAALMKRLELGLERRAEADATPELSPKGEPSDANLRSTLDELRAMAMRR